MKLLQEELEKARRERTSEINKKNEVIRKLKGMNNVVEGKGGGGGRWRKEYSLNSRRVLEELRQIKHEAEEATKRLETRSKQKEDIDMQKFRDKVKGEKSN